MKVSALAGGVWGADSSSVATARREYFLDSRVCASYPYSLGRSRVTGVVF